LVVPAKEAIMYYGYGVGGLLVLILLILLLTGRI
jgi:uncharacterized protein DUF3309